MEMNLARARQETERDAQRTKIAQEELVDRLGRLLPVDGTVEPLAGLQLTRHSQRSDHILGVYEPSICVIAQGRKEVLLGDECYPYDSSHYLVNTVDLPVVGQIVEASRDRPYLSLRLVLDPALVGSVLVEANLPAPRNPADVRGIAASRLDFELLDAFLRLVRLLGDPSARHARMLAPTVIREIIYRLLLGEQRSRLRHVAVLDGNPHRIAEAVNRLRTGFDRPLRIDEIARDAGMSASAFHRQFKAVTTMSPLQFQKQLRLQEARRLMLGENLDAASAGYRVGYDDASHFSREYKRLFGVPPMRDVERLRETARSAG